MKGVLSEISSFGMSIAAFSRRCDGIAYATLQKIDQGARVRPDKIARVQQVLSQIRAERRNRNKVSA